ncbi:hypothetical protein N8I77_012011 [Diaporthe amygdali]|uniref:AAA+ ATPase domain-containing protein n=1 Tax=Phomopsis amygdali TaxID=1214568 RepID=A0AAD9S4V3_PHOAM|nr:hypothetical protein N8I77_012011 [Diaporthe amygdali]
MPPPRPPGGFPPPMPVPPPPGLPVETPEQRRERILKYRRSIEARWRPKLPEVIKLDLEHFKNSYEDDKPGYAVEVLVGPPNIGAQIRAEDERRRGLNHSAQYAWLASQDLLFDEWRRTDENWKWASAFSKQRRLGPTTEVSSRSDDMFIHRVRIQSMPVLGYLQRLLGEPRRRYRYRTFFRPFRPLIYFQPRMKEILTLLEKKWSQKEHEQDDQNSGMNRVPNAESQTETIRIHDVPPADRPAISDQSTEDRTSEAEKTNETDDDDISSVKSEDDSTTERMNQIMDSIEALRDMKCYVEFVDKEIMPHYNFLKGAEARKVAFHDLWCLYDVGGLVFAPITRGENDSYQDIWRIYRVQGPDPFLSYYPPWQGQPSDGFDVDTDTSFTLFCYHIGHDGSSYGAVRRKFDIEAFPGERDIQSLDAYPLRFVENHEQLLGTMKEQGLRYQNALNERNLAYNNWSLAVNPQEDSDSDSEGEQRKKKHATHPVLAEFIESQVIIDLDEAFRANPRWRPKFHKPSISKASPLETKLDGWPKQIWNDKSRSKLLYSIPELIQYDDGIDIRKRRDNILNNDLFLLNRSKGSRWERTGYNFMDLRDEDIALLPKRLFAYTLRERKFVAVDVNYLRPILREEGVFARLMIWKDYKDIVRGLVSSHFQKKELERLYSSNAIEGLSQDLIQGKGKGLVLLLHGAPGVGKTATAEAVAMENNKPLFAITCGDLGLTASEVESSLTDMFRLAHKWDCVLLLDEADVFLSQRSRFDMKRNALVSVFLRVLEYYNGLLFLTTNRVGTIDEAFKSRIHLSLYYPPLDLTQTREIFRLNINKLRDIERQRSELTAKPELIIKEDDIIRFAEEHYNNPVDSLGRWNGRQIRNAFQIASGLAYYHFATQSQASSSPEDNLQGAPILDSSLFKKVQHATQNFDKYMRETRGWTDADLSHLLGERSDHMRNNRFPQASAPSTQQTVPDVFGESPAAASAGHGGYPFASSYMSAHPQEGSFPRTPVTPRNFAQHEAGPQGPSYMPHQNMPPQQAADPKPQFIPAAFHAQAQTRQMQPNTTMSQGNPFSPASAAMPPVYSTVSTPQHNTGYDMPHAGSLYSSNTQAAQSQWHAGQPHNMESWASHSPGVSQTMSRESEEEQSLY